jgi:putative endonuclease
MFTSKGFVYVLKCHDQKLYIGSTRDLEERLTSHKMGRVKTTKSRRPILLVYLEEFEHYQEARKRELYLKTGTGRDWLKLTLRTHGAFKSDGLVRPGESA